MKIGEVFINGQLGQKKVLVFEPNSRKLVVYSAGKIHTLLKYNLMGGNVLSVSFYIAFWTDFWLHVLE